MTSVHEARASQQAGMDAVVVQARCAGGHSATWTPAVPVPDVALPALLADIRAGAGVECWGAGGVGTPEAALEAFAAGATAVQIGTALLRTHEAGSSPTLRGVLAELAAGPAPDRILTRAFSGRPAGAVSNAFTDAYDAIAPIGYPALHHLTGPIRRAAAAAGAGEWINVWGGPGIGATTVESAEFVLRRVADVSGRSPLGFGRE